MRKLVGKQNAYPGHFTIMLIGSRKFESFTITRSFTDEKDFISA